EQASSPPDHAGERPPCSREAKSSAWAPCSRRDDYHGRPDQMWGTDATSVQTLEEGTVSVFAAVDHCTAECAGIHAARRATRFGALEPIRQGVRERFGVYAKEVARGLVVRHDHGSQYVSDDFQNEA